MGRSIGWASRDCKKVLFRDSPNEKHTEHHRNCYRKNAPLNVIQDEAYMGLPLRTGVVSVIVPLPRARDVLGCRVVGETLRNFHFSPFCQLYHCAFCAKPVENMPFIISDLYHFSEFSTFSTKGTDSKPCYIRLSSLNLSVL